MKFFNNEIKNKKKDRLGLNSRLLNIQNKFFYSFSDILWNVVIFYSESDETIIKRYNLFLCIWPNFHRPPSLTMLECPSLFFANLLTLIFWGEDNYCPSTLVFYLLIFKLYFKILSHIFVLISWSFISKYIFQRLCKMLSFSLGIAVSIELRL